MATRSGTPARTRLRTAVRRKSCGIRPGHPAATRAFLHALLKPLSVICLPVLQQKNVAHDDALFFFQRLGSRLLVFEDPPQLRREREHAALAVLRRARIQPNFPGLEIDLAPREDL